MGHTLLLKMLDRGQQVLAETAHQVERKRAAAADPLGEGLVAGEFHQDRRPPRHRRLADETNDVLMLVQTAKHFGLRAHAIGMGGVNCDLEDARIFLVVAPDQQGVGAAAAAETPDPRSCRRRVFLPASRSTGRRAETRFGRVAAPLLRLGPDIQGTRRASRRRARTDGFVEAFTSSSSQMPTPLTKAERRSPSLHRQSRRQFESAVGRGTPGEDVIRDRSEREDISLRRALSAPAAASGAR